jgi:CRP-like cAMP-binding protein
MTAIPPEPRHSKGNRILAALGGADLERLSAHLERVELEQGQVIHEPETPIEHAYFPETAVFSMLATMENGDTVEVGPVGHEGMVGIRLFLGADTARYSVLVHVEGTAVRMRASALREELAAGASPLPRLLTRYTQKLLAMTGQSCACFKLHRLDQQLARWLLVIHHYVGDEIRLTHELISLTLGVRRASISDAASEMRDAGLIDYHRGRIRIVDRAGLEQKPCECYLQVREEYDTLYADLRKLSA